VIRLETSNGGRQLSLVDSFTCDDETVTHVEEIVEAVEEEVSIPTPAFQREYKAPPLERMKREVSKVERLAKQMVARDVHKVNAKDALLLIDLWRKGDMRIRKDIPQYKPNSPHLFQTLEMWYSRNREFVS